MDMTEMNHPGSESETELSIKLEDPEAEAEELAREDIAQKLLDTLPVP